MKTRNQAHQSNSTVAVLVIFAVLLFLTMPFISIYANISDETGLSGMSPGESVSGSVMLDIISPLNVSFKAAEQNGISLAERSLKHSLHFLQLSIIMVLAFALLKTHGRRCHLSKAIIRISPISISIGGHAPPFFRV